MTGYKLRRAFPGARKRWRPDLDYIARFLCETWGMRRVGTTNAGSPIVADGMQPNGGKWWVIADNGGELNVVPINDDEAMVSVPYEQHRQRVPIGRVAWFCRCVMVGDPITDYASSPLDDVTIAELRSEP